MSSFPPEGFRVRGAGDDDLDLVARVLEAEERSVRGVSTMGLGEIRDWWRLSNRDSGAWIVESPDARPAAFAAMIERGDTPECWASVAPPFTGRGLATGLIAAAEGRARELAAQRLRAGAFAENDAARRLFAALGYAEARHYFHMRIELESASAAPVWPDGVAVDTFRSEDARAFHAALDEAFAEEWGNVAMTFDEWRRFRIEDPHVDLSLWFVARGGNEIAGVCRCDPSRYGGGWIGALGVRPAWRRRGIGRALLLHAFAEFRRRRAPHVSLGVDAANESGATHLYESVGMHVVTEDVVFEKALA
jgi:mycothiol synthase